MATRTRRPAASPARRRPAGAPVSPGRLERSATQESLTCCVCVEVLVAPVTLKCGHSVCRHCLVAHFESLDLRALLGSTGAVVCPAARCAVPLEVPETNISLQVLLYCIVLLLTLLGPPPHPPLILLPHPPHALFLPVHGTRHPRSPPSPRTPCRSPCRHTSTCSATYSVTPSYNQAAIASRYEALVAARTDLPTERELAGRIAALRVAASGMVQLELTQQERELLERERLRQNDAGMQQEVMRPVTRVRSWAHANGRWLLKWWLRSAAAIQAAGLLYWVFLSREPATLIEMLLDTTILCVASALPLCLWVADRGAEDVAKYLIAATFSRMRGWVKLMFAPRQAWHVDVLIICFLCAVAFAWQHLQLGTPADPDAVAQLTLHAPNATSYKHATDFARSLTLVAIDQQTILPRGSIFASLVVFGIWGHALAYPSETDFCYVCDKVIQNLIHSYFGVTKLWPRGLQAVLAPSHCMTLHLLLEVERRLVLAAVRAAAGEQTAALVEKATMAIEQAAMSAPWRPPWGEAHVVDWLFALLHGVAPPT